MFFFLSKILTYFLYPLTWVLILLLLGLAFKKKRRLFNIVALIFFLVFSNGYLLNRVAAWWDAPPVNLPAGSKYSCVIVLGGFQAQDKEERGYFNASSDRFIQALSLYKQGYANKILVTGGSGMLGKSSLLYSSWAKNEFIKCGVPAGDVLVEDESRNTFENAQFSKKVLLAAGLNPPYILVTSAFHMKRSLWVFGHEKMPVVAYPCNYTFGKGDWYLGDLLPNATPLAAWYTYFKEIIGLQAYKIKASL